MIKNTNKNINELLSIFLKKSTCTHTLTRKQNLKYKQEKKILSNVF